MHHSNPDDKEVKADDALFRSYQLSFSESKNLCDFHAKRIGQYLMNMGVLSTAIFRQFIMIGSKRSFSKKCENV